MNAVILIFSVALVLCLVMTPICRDLFLRFNIVDSPDSERKFHLKPIPRIGGIPIVLSYAGALGLLLTLAPRGAAISIQHLRLFLSLLPATGLIFLTGLVDDIFTLKPKQKLFGQFVAAVLAVSLGARMSMDGIPHSSLITIPLSIIWLIGCTNAVNLIDGLDGLASGVGLFATLTTLVAALVTGNTGLAIATAPLLGCLLAFLRYNFSPASIFLGDCGSLTIGFMLGCFGLVWSQHTGTMLGMAAPLMALTFPLLDVILSVTRRSLRSRPIFKGDRGHIHHMVLALGHKPHVAALILYGVSAVAALFALLASLSGIRFLGPIFISFCILIWSGINRLGYVEVSAARRTLSRKNVFRILKEEIYLQELESSINAAKTVEESWTIVQNACSEMCFTSVQMFVAGTVYEANFDKSQIHPCWKMNLVVGRSGYLVLTRGEEGRPHRLMGSVLFILQESLRSKSYVAPRPVEVLEAETTYFVNGTHYSSEPLARPTLTVQ
ncbi:MraY family glycosyltransferase [Edaphobacter sp. HDX4]|uniref:MraY family glycosyltransferase n=1 Tax=Edaphobacter sp. HDX4 TaxID=2794064 RepID=UPI002FE52D07